MRQKLNLETVAGLLGDQRGLSSAEVEARRRKYGNNDIVEIAGNPWGELARETARDPMIWFLVGTAGLYLVLGSTIEAITLFVAILPLVGMDAYLHRRTQASTAGLRQKLASGASVLRDGTWSEIPAIDLVPGDLARVGGGQAFPADGVIVFAEEAQADESSVTGEAYPVRKRALPPLPPGKEDPIVDGAHWGFAGTRLLTGAVLQRVVATGRETIYGAIVRSAGGEAKALTPLQQAVADLVRKLLLAAAALCVVLAAARIRQGHGWFDALISAATLGVAALPEEFPVVLTVFLGVGVYRLAGRKALVRRAVSVENIGRVSCICTDKTGTITEGRLRLERIVPAGLMSTERLLRIAALASREESADPLDAAVLKRLSEDGLERPIVALVATFPFTENRRRETAVVEMEGEVLAVTKGSPEVILEMSEVEDEGRMLWRRRIEELASGGRKVIACAYRSLPSGPSGPSGPPGEGEPDRGFQLAGALVFEDPLREGAREAVETCRKAGIRVMMVTGDHPETARSVATSVGLGGGLPKIISGDEMTGLAGEPLARLLEGVDVIARAMPLHKLALVRALQTAGEVVVVTGDGVNDVPALQAADVGVAMGERGTRSAREVAAIVLLDDNFNSIVGAISEGRQLFRNLQLSFQYLLMFHIPLVLTGAFIPLVGHPLLYLPIHIVWLEAMIHPTALLVFQELPRTKRLGRIQRVRRGRPRESARFFSRLDWLEIGLVGALGTLLVCLSFERSLGDRVDVEHARAMALVSLVGFGVALTASLSGLRTRTARLLAAASLLLAVVLVQTKHLSALVHLSPLHLDDWAVGIAGGFLAVFVPRALLRIFPASRRA
jgi:Ca2+-transporting ATPase